MGGWHAIVGGGQEVPLERTADIGRLAALGAWRYSQGIYRFHPEIYEALCGTEISGDLPADVLLRLPEWCVYIETPGLCFGDEQMFGFFAHLEHDSNSGRKELRIVIDVQSGLFGFPLHLGRWSVEEAIRRSLCEAQSQAQRLNHEGKEMFEDPFAPKRMAPFFSSMISLLLYLCSDEPQIDDARQPGTSPAYPRAKKVKGGMKLFAPPSSRTWNVGFAAGEQIVQARTRARSGSERQGPRPHLRRAHWHGYWKGPRTGERTFHYKWLAPVFVAAENAQS
ncbi:AcrVA2 family anti-CRISPR protein [Geoalkalibacter subterraneus]|nr:hypothetical protein [Geoalkalibacter subterraneus]